ncbi:MAG: aminoacyl-tRNA hydrolase [Acidobacteriota bacterium]
MKILLGLGNPGEQYVATRHNVGFRVLEALAARSGVAFADEQCRSLTATVLPSDAGERFVLAKPQTFMNRSGYAARCLLERLDAPSTDLLVIYDEVHLPLGTLRLRTKGSPAGHRGLESILENLGTDEVPRLRLGVGPREGEPPAALADYVLGTFGAGEVNDVESMIARAADACEMWLGTGADSAMQRFNGPAPSASTTKSGESEL